MTLAVRAQDFTKSLTAEERAATGLDQLSAAQLEQFKAVVERYKTGEVAVVKKEAEKKVTAAEAKVKEVEAKVHAPPAETAKNPGWFTALVTLQKTGEKPDEAGVVEGQLVGPLKTFDGRRKFEFQDGQVWQMTESGFYHGPTLQSLRVIVRPSFLGVYWLEITEGALRVKVKLLKAE